MPWIENISREDLKSGLHPIDGDMVLISINDIASCPPTPKFAEVHVFEFLDIEAGDFALEEEMRCTQEQANELVGILRLAKNRGMNVIVQCHIGYSRSGAVVEVAEALGFAPTNPARCPNRLVVSCMLNAVGPLLDKFHGQYDHKWY